MAEHVILGYTCFTCKQTVGRTHGDAVNHVCMEGLPQVYVVDNIVYPFNPHEAEPSNPVDTPVAKSEFKWTTSAIALLLELRLSKEHQFRHPSCKKKKLWSGIADEMMKVISADITFDMCDSKYRNLLATYRVNKKKQRTTGESAITWEYFEKMDEVLGQKASSHPAENMLMDTLQPLSPSSELDGEEGASTSSSVQSFSDTSSVGREKRKKSKDSLTLSEYLYCKIKSDEERQRMREERWKEQKELKERGINAILDLAKALTNNK